MRYAEVDRETKETKIHLVLDLDGGNRCDVSTGIPFFDHMLHQSAFCGRMDLGLTADGDLDIDDHHTIEDVGITLGQALKKALVDSAGIVRHASSHVAMDDALVMVAIDMGGRSYLGWEVAFERENIGGMSTQNVREFFAAMVAHGGMSLHIRKLAGHNDHHVCEAVFKAFGLALHQATQRSERKGSNSSK